VLDYFCTGLLSGGWILRDEYYKQYW